MRLKNCHVQKKETKILLLLLVYVSEKSRVRTQDLSNHQTNSTLIYFVFSSSIGPPDAPTNCSVVNQTTDSLDVQCLSGFDGGLEQHFLLEVADLQTGLLLANASDKIPEFRVSFDDVI